MRSIGFAVGLSLALVACDGGDDKPPPPPPVTFGSAVIGWTIQDLAGTTLTCDELGLSQASISLGPDRVDIPCGDEQSVRFDRLTEGIYGVTLRLDIAGRGELLSQTDNVEVVAAQETKLDMIIEIDTGTFDRGRLKFEWTVNGQPPSSECSAIGAETVHIQTDSNSIAQFTVDEDCTVGEVLLQDLKPGNYVGRAEMRDASGTIVGSPWSFGLRVEEDEQTDHSIVFFTSSERSSFIGSWSITSTAANACADVSADFVRVGLRSVMLDGTTGNESATASAACDAGSIFMDDLDPTPAGLRVRASFTLISEFLGSLGTVTATTFVLLEGMTSSVTVVFDLQ